MSLITEFALDLRRRYGGSAPSWQQALDACGSDERAHWLLDNAWPDHRPVAWTPDRLIVAHAAARLLEDGPRGAQAVHAPT
jgi:hypothetical protein